MNNIPVGEVRPSQLLWTYGPGALIDLPNLSVITMGLDRWDQARCSPVEEARLLEAVRRVLGPQVERLRMPPIKPGEAANPLDAEARIGVPVRPFPRWLRCVRCGTLAEFDSGLFSIKDNPYRPEDTRFVHKNCEKGNASDAVPARFLMACRAGHLDDFPWRYFLHEGQGFPDCKGTLRFFEQGASLQTENLWVKCDGCAVPPRSLVLAFGREAEKNLPACRGRHPHLNMFDEVCEEKPRAVLLGSTNSWFSISLSVLAIPQGKDRLSQLIEDGWKYFATKDSKAKIEVTLETLIDGSLLPGIESFTVDQVWNAIEAKRSGTTDAPPKETDIKRPEWRVLTDPAAPNDWPYFLTAKAGVPAELTETIKDVLLLQRLREVNALIGFTRVEAPEESDDPDERPPMASLSRSKQPTWVPAFDVHGEGIFIRLQEDLIKAWEDLPQVQKRDDRLKTGHRGWRNARQLDPDKGYPGIRYAMLHTFSHLLVRELALECGYNAASIRERIYSDPNGEDPMAGLLLYTAAADSDGTLGGLVELGKPENLGRLIKQALRRATVCSSDPLCSEHNAATDRTLHGASCHACGFVAETSCERGNRYPRPRPPGADVRLSRCLHIPERLMGMKDLDTAIARIALEVHPDRIEAVCVALGARGTSPLATVKNALGDAFSPSLLDALDRALGASPRVSADELSAMFRVASATASLAAGASSVEWVWTGPATGLVPIRHTAQVLTGLIDEARERLFLVSFVAYHVTTVVDALKRAIERKVRLEVLLESSQDSGGNVSVDSASILKRSLPRARFYQWKKPAGSLGASASVHAKCALADGVIAFVTSANLSDAAMERNIELGILVRGGLVPKQLDSHLQALITTKQLDRL